MHIFLFGLWVLCWGIQMFYLFYFFSRLLFKNEPLKGSSKAPFVSIVVCAHNEESNLRELIPLLLNQAYEDFEVIIVDDRSRDGTYVLLNQWFEKDERIKAIHIQKTPTEYQSKKYALEQGIHKAKGEVILLTDADCRPIGQNWLKSMSLQFEPGIEIVLGFSPYVQRKGFLNAFIQYETFYTFLQYASFARAGFPYMGVGRNLAYLRKTFIKEGGWGEHQQTVGGDDDLFIAKVAQTGNTRVNLALESQVYSFPKLKWRDWYRQKLRHLSVGKFYKFPIKLTLGLLHFSQAGIYFLFFVLMLISVNATILLTSAFLLIIRLIIQTIIYSKINRKIGAQLYGICIPFFDFLFVLYIFIVGVVAFSKKQIRWS